MGHSGPRIGSKKQCHYHGNNLLSRRLLGFQGGIVPVASLGELGPDHYTLRTRIAQPQLVGNITCTRVIYKAEYNVQAHEVYRF